MDAWSGILEGVQGVGPPFVEQLQQHKTSSTRSIVVVVGQHRDDGEYDVPHCLSGSWGEYTAEKARAEGGGRALRVAVHPSRKLNKSWNKKRKRSRSKNKMVDPG